jgi:integrase
LGCGRSSLRSGRFIPEAFHSGKSISSGPREAEVTRCHKRRSNDSTNVLSGLARRRRTPYDLALGTGGALVTARPQRLYPAIHLAAHTGMRRGEIVGLKWTDLDESRSRLSITRTVQCVGGRPAEFGVKTRTSRRTVELDHHTLELLINWRRRLQRDRLPYGAHDWMFCNAHGRFLNPESINQLFDRVVRRCDVPRIRFHDLRHTHASLLVADGTPIKVVTERLGHAHPAFTMHTYQHVLPGMSATAAERFAELVSAAAGRRLPATEPRSPQLNRDPLD